MKLSKWNLFLVVMPLALSACGKGDKGDPGANGTNAPTTASILSKFVAVDSASRIQSLDLSNLALNAVSPINSVVDCVADLGGNPDVSGSASVNGVNKNEVGLSGSGNAGLIQFGPLSHANQNLDNVCYTLGQELYSYIISGQTLTLCNLTYSVCSEFSAVE